ncbi:protein mono-ADP-ribosyltransferase PARP14-like [Littorina saxatilis]|uniref:protein mono-ADP-ribosyltransferase PARP14-like n=1 Tax=Littorina saxatilis TaxID=31220 RepID=UPI0038B684C0
MIRLIETPTTLSKNSKPSAETPISAMIEDDIPNLRPWQFKILCIPAALDKFYRCYPGLKVSVDKERRTAKVSAPEDKMKKAFSDVLVFAMSLRETKMSLKPGLLKMFEREDTKEWIQETVISEHGFVCHWEVSEKQIIISGQSSDLARIQEMFEEAFEEKTIKLETEEACTLKSPAWRSFLEQLEDSDSHPQPVLLPGGDSVIIVDTPSHISSTELKLKEFLKENKLEGKTLEISPNKAKLLMEFCDHEVKELIKKAKDVGVNISFNKNGLQAHGLKDCLPGVEGEVREMVARIKEDKMTFKKPGMARYLKGSKGNDFLGQTGSVTKCYITTDGGGAGASQSGGRVLAKAQLSPTLDLQIIQGDITQCAVDAIVNAANGRLKHDGGVAAAIVKAGGRCIQEESDELVAENGELNDGEVMVTGAGTLPCSHIIHAVGPIWSGGTKGEEEALIRTVKSILKEAEKMKLASVAIPAISCGIFRYPVDRATSTIMKTIAQFLQRGRDLSLQTVVLIDLGADPLRGFISAGKLLFGKRLEEKDTPTSAPPRGKHSGGSSHKPTERTERGHSVTQDSHRSRTDHGHDETSQGPIKIIPGEIAKSKTDVIVCTTHPSLDLQKGVLSKSIAREGGDAIQQELKKYHENVGAAELGRVVRTSGGNLRCKLVFHLSLPSWRDDHGKAMKSAVKGCLDEASKKKQKSIAFPSLGTGRLGYPSDKVASIMQSAISQWFSDNHRTTLKEAQIIVFPKDTETLQAFKNNDRHGGGHSEGRGHGHRGGRGRDADHSGGPSNCKVKVGKITVMVKEGDILAESCDAIVNSSNDSLDLTKGVVSKAIMKACGQEIVLECSKQKDEMGEHGVVVTRVDGLASCRHVIHVSADRFKGDWTEGILAVLRLAEEEGIRSVAMPALGTGGKGANPEKLAQAMQEAVKEFSRESKSVVFQKQMMRPYISAFDPDASSSSSRGADRSDSGDGASADRGEKRQTHAADVFIYFLQPSTIKDAREKIHRHMTSIFTSKTETNPVIASFNAKQKDEMFKLQKKHNVEISLDDKNGAVTFTGIDICVTSAVSDLKDIILSATTQRHLAAAGPPVRWQYQTGKDKFTDYDPETNLTIEAAFKKKQSSVHFSDKRSRRYTIVFRDKKEYSVDDRSAQPVTVKRRDIMEEKKHDIPLPDHWEPMKGHKVKQVQLKSDSSEYKRVAGLFGRQGQANIKKIERIQNPSLFQQYKIKKRDLEQNNPKGTENEKRLFHGTSSDSIQGIVTNGFNRSYCGKNGTALGNGVYFAADSATSMGYAAQGGQMFQARVLVGEYTPGNSGMRTAPIKPSSNRPYDSVSNGPPPNATVFVIFHDCQAYPEYLISF